MKSGFALYFCILFVAGMAAYPNQLNKGVIKFRISGRNFDSKDPFGGASDPYVEVFYTENGGSKETKLGRSETISNNNNPSWSTIFEFNYDRAKNQQLHLQIWDQDDFQSDDKVGRTWLDLNDYVDRAQLVNIPLYKEGYAKVERLELNAPAAPRILPEIQKIKFKISATNLPDEDTGFGTIANLANMPMPTDPFAEIYSADGIAGKEVLIGTTSKINNNENPIWGEVFDYNFDAKKHQRLVFKIYDQDKLRTDDKGGFGFVDMEDYMRRGQSITVNLSKRGKLTMTRV